MRMTFLLGSVIAVAATVAVVGTGRSRAAKAEPAAVVAAVAAPEPAPENQGPAPLTGEVLETLAASRYTYLRLRTAMGEVWAAVPAAAVTLHSQVAVADAARMDDFKSATLKRTFKVVYFGTLARDAATTPLPARGTATLPAVRDDQLLPPGHPDIGVPTPSSTEGDGADLPPGHPDIEGAGPFGK